MAAALSLTFATLHGQTDRVQLQLNTTEADQVLSILALRAAGKPIGEASWHELFASEPYQRLKAREDRQAISRSRQ